MHMQPLVQVCISLGGAHGLPSRLLAGNRNTVTGCTSAAVSEVTPDWVLRAQKLGLGLTVEAMALAPATCSREGLLEDLPLPRAVCSLVCPYCHGDLSEWGGSTACRPRPACPAWPGSPSEEPGCVSQASVQQMKGLLWEEPLLGER